MSKYYELPIEFESNESEKPEIDYAVIDLNETQSFNPSSEEGKTTLRLRGDGNFAFTVLMTYQEFRDLFKSKVAEIETAL